MVKIHPFGILVIVLWCAMAVISQSIVAAQNEEALLAAEAEPEPEPEPAPEEGEGEAEAEPAG